MSTGTFGDCSTFSFYGNKTFTTGEGGMILFKKKKNYEYAKILRDHGMSTKKKYYHEHVGFNFRLTNLQSAIGLAQLERYSLINKTKKNIAKKYLDELKSISQLQFQKIDKKKIHSYWAFPIVFKLKKQKEITKKYLMKNGIETRDFFYPMNIQKAFKKYATKKNLKTSKDIYNRGLCLPTFNGLQDYEQKNIIKQIKEISKKF